jgi:hypothetical protein
LRDFVNEGEYLIDLSGKKYVYKFILYKNAELFTLGFTPDEILDYIEEGQEEIFKTKYDKLSKKLDIIEEKISEIDAKRADKENVSTTEHV